MADAFEFDSWAATWLAIATESQLEELHGKLTRWDFPETISALDTREHRTMRRLVDEEYARRREKARHG